MNRLFSGICLDLLVALCTAQTVCAEKNSFDEIDTDQNDIIEPHEIAPENRALFDRLVRKLDTDRNGSLDRAEFTSRTSGAPAEFVGGRSEKQLRDRPGRGGRGARMFQRLDSDQDGRITLEEVPEERRERFERLLRAHDGDGDGAVSAAEFENARAGGKNGDAAKGAKKRCRDPKSSNGRDAKRFNDTGRFGNGRGWRAGDRGAGRPKEGRGGPFLRALDADGDGALSSAEIAAASSSLLELDRNGDGDISPDELHPFLAIRPDGQSADKQRIVRRRSRRRNSFSFDRTAQ